MEGLSSLMRFSFRVFRFAFFVSRSNPNLIACTVIASEAKQSFYPFVFYFCLLSYKFHLCIMIKSILSFLLSLPVLLYRYSISPFLRPSCRHVPTCSQFMLDALKIHGPFIGMLLGTGRILRCRPGGTHGYDPVPLFRFKKYKPLLIFFSGFKKGNRLKDTA